MGTKNCPETPRQKMINMMYLVLTAMLALNVAAETLYAFKIVDESLMQTYLSFTDKNKTLISDFEQAYDLNQSKVERWMNMANEVHQKSDSLVSYILETKEMLVYGAGAEVKDPEDELSEEFPYIISRKNDTIVLQRQDDLNISPEIMLTKGRGEDLQKKIQEYRAELIEVVNNNPSIVNNLESSLDVDDPERGEMKLDNDELNSRSWVRRNFEATPVIASIALLSKLQIDVRNAESAVLRHLYNQIDASSFKFTGLSAKVIPEASYIFQGQEYKARIFLSAEDSTNDLTVYMDGRESPLPIEGNEAIFSIKPDQPGEYNYSGYIKYKNPDGEGEGIKPFEFKFEVAKPAVTISPTKMNVLYKDLQNPVSISVPGVPNSALQPVCTNGKMYQSGDSWIVEPAELDYEGLNTRVIVYADIQDEKRSMGEMVFRVKKVPDPKAMIARRATGSIPREMLRVQVGVFAVLEDFDFDLSFEVTSFDLSVPTSGGLTQTLHSNSYRFTNEQKQLLNSLGAGDKISIENIRAKIADDEQDDERQLSPIILTVQ